MVVVRARLSWIAAAWLCCQLSLLAAAPVSLAYGPSKAADPVTCTCVHSGAAQCPMHHPAKTPSSCQCRSTTDPGAAAVVALLGPAAVLASVAARVTPPPITKLPTYPINNFTDFIPSIDAPPPRA